MITISRKHTTIEIRPGLISPWQASFLLIGFFILLHVLINLAQQRYHSCSIALPISNRKRFQSVSFSMDSLTNQLPWRMKRPRGTREVKLWRKQEATSLSVSEELQKEQEEKAARSCKQWLAAKKISENWVIFSHLKKSGEQHLLGGQRILALHSS